jgi:stage IV sporulation protein B
MPMEFHEIKLLPCGHSIGMDILRKNFKIVDLSPVMKPNGIYYYPARDEDLRVNDIILEVEGQKIMSEFELYRLINEVSKVNHCVEIKIQRRDKILAKKVTPYYSPRCQGYKLGIVLKALDIGIGTLSFFDPVTKKFGALAHFLGNLPGGANPNNRLVASSVCSIEKGKPDMPGKKVGHLNHFNEFTGNIEINCQAGIFGTITGQIDSPFFDSPLPVSLKNEIIEHQATIYTVLDGTEIEKFNIKILEIETNSVSNQDIKILIDDEGLIERTGGIIQGMSGSPIIQNGNLIGAISFLSRSNSLQGYAVSIQNMLYISGLYAPSF